MAWTVIPACFCCRQGLMLLILPRQYACRLGARKSNTSTLLLTVTAENASLGDLQEPGTRSSHGPSTAGGNRAWVLIGASDQYRIVKETTNPMTLQLLLPASCFLLTPSSFLLPPDRCLRGKDPQVASRPGGLSLAWAE